MCAVAPKTAVNKYKQLHNVLWKIIKICTHGNKTLTFSWNIYIHVQYVFIKENKVFL